MKVKYYCKLNCEVKVVAIWILDVVLISLIILCRGRVGSWIMLTGKQWF